MQVIKYLGQGSTQMEILVHTYSKEEWVEIKKEKFGPEETGGLGLYFPDDYSIHILQKEDFPSDIWMQGINVTWEHVLIHEYIHYLQHMKSCWDELIPIDPKGKGVPMTWAFKKVYPLDSWAIEAEAHWYMYRPKELGLKLVLA